MVAQIPNQPAPEPVEVTPAPIVETPPDDLAGSVVVVDAEQLPDDDVDHDRIELVRTGLVRVYVGDTRYRLRRPFFGELKALRLALADVTDDLADRRMEVAVVAQEMLAEQRTIDESTDLTSEQRLAQLRDLRKRDRALGRALTDDAETARIEWWGQVFDAVSLDGIPQAWPGWFVDPNLPDRVLSHWRSAPLGRG